MDSLQEALQWGGHAPTTHSYIDLFLSGVKQLGEAIPSDSDLKITRSLISHLETTTLRDFLVSTEADPTTLATSMREITRAEKFVNVCSRGGDMKKLNAIIDSDWRVIFAKDRDGRTALHAAAACNNADVTRLLLHHHASPFVRDYENLSALDWAVANDSRDSGALLHEIGQGTPLEAPSPGSGAKY